MSTVAEPMPENSIIFSTQPDLMLALADCECQIHREAHTEPGPCEHRAAYLLTGTSMFSLKAVIRMYLCRECVEWHHNHIRHTRPLLDLTVLALD